MRIKAGLAAALAVTVSVVCGGAHALSVEDASENARAAREHVQTYYDVVGPGASFLISHKGAVLVSEAAGFADLEFGLPNTERTIHRLGSISKSLTAVAVLQLMEKGVVDLDTAISAYAPALPEHMGRVTLRQLMSHRSGLAEHAMKQALLDDIWFPMTTADLIELQANDPVVFEPGAKYQYVNFNYVLVAHVIESVTGKPFVEFANEDMFAANGLAHSYYDVHYDVIPCRAEFYDIQRPPFYPTTNEDIVVNAADLDMSHVSAAGALLSATIDMNKWSQMLLNGDLISHEARETAWAPAPLADGTPTSYGLGFNVAELAGERLIWHSGSTPGAQAAYGIAPAEGVFVVILSNGYHLPNTTKIMRELMSIMLTGDAAAADQ